MEHQHEDLIERSLTITNPIKLDDSNRGTVLNGNGGKTAYSLPSLSFVYFLQTEHDKIIINCKEAGKLLANFARVDVDVYISPLSYDYLNKTPTVTFKQKPKTFHINVLVPGILPQPTDDRPPYGYGEEVSLANLSICTPTKPSAKKPSTTVKPNNQPERNADSKHGTEVATTRNLPSHDPSALNAGSTGGLLQLEQENIKASGSDRKRQRSEVDEPSSPESSSQRRRKLHRNCKLTEAPKETNSRSPRRKPNPAFS